MLSMRDYSRGYEKYGRVVFEWTGRHDTVSREQTHFRPLPPHAHGSARQYELLFLAFMAPHQARWWSRGMERLCTFLHSGCASGVHIAAQRQTVTSSRVGAL